RDVHDVVKRDQGELTHDGRETGPVFVVPLVLSRGLKIALTAVRLKPLDAPRAPLVTSELFGESRTVQRLTIARLFDRLARKRVTVHSGRDEHDVTDSPPSQTVEPRVTVNVQRNERVSHDLPFPASHPERCDVRQSSRLTRREQNSRITGRHGFQPFDRFRVATASRHPCRFTVPPVFNAPGFRDCHGSAVVKPDHHCWHPFRTSVRRAKRTESTRHRLHGPLPLPKRTRIVLSVRAHRTVSTLGADRVSSRACRFRYVPRVTSLCPLPARGRMHEHPSPFSCSTSAERYATTARHGQGFRHPRYPAIRSHITRRFPVRQECVIIHARFRMFRCSDRSHRQTGQSVSVSDWF